MHELLKFLATFVSDIWDSCELRGGVYLLDSLPTTSTGKVLRRKVKDIVAGMRNNADA